jgi:hypothetical protein
MRHIACRRSSARDVVHLLSCHPRFSNFATFSCPSRFQHEMHVVYNDSSEMQLLGSLAALQMYTCSVLRFEQLMRYFRRHLREICQDTNRNNLVREVRRLLFLNLRLFGDKSEICAISSEHTSALYYRLVAAAPWGGKHVPSHMKVCRAENLRLNVAELLSPPTAIR